MRAFGYVRISKLDERTTSPARQREAIKRLCEARGWELVKVYEDLDVSGYQKSAKRPGLDRMLSRLDETDATRSRYVRKLYRRDPADASLYHLVLDATVLSTHDCVAVIAAAAQASWTFDELAVDEHLSSGRASDDPG